MRIPSRQSTTARRSSLSHEPFILADVHLADIDAELVGNIAPDGLSIACSLQGLLPSTICCARPRVRRAFFRCRLYGFRQQSRCRGRSLHHVNSKRAPIRPTHAHSLSLLSARSSLEHPPRHGRPDLVASTFPSKTCGIHALEIDTLIREL